MANSLLWVQKWVFSSHLPTVLRVFVRSLRQRFNDQPLGGDVELQAYGSRKIWLLLVESACGEHAARHKLGAMVGDLQDEDMISSCVKA